MVEIPLFTYIFNILVLASIWQLYLPVSGGEVLQGAGGPLQRGGVGAFGQQVEVRLHHHRVPQQLGSSQGLGEARDRPPVVPLHKQQTLPIKTWNISSSIKVLQVLNSSWRAPPPSSLYLVIGPAAALPPAPPLAPAEVVQLLARKGEAQEGVELLVAEETRGGHLHLQPVREVPQGADAVLHNLRGHNKASALSTRKSEPAGGARRREIKINSILKYYQSNCVFMIWFTF